MIIPPNDTDDSLKYIAYCPAIIGNKSI